jgi:hypothetical protein
MREPLDNPEKLSKLYELERQGYIYSEVDKEDDKVRRFYRKGSSLTDIKLENLWMEYQYDENHKKIFRRKDISYLQ